MDCLGEGFRVMYPNWCGIEETLDTDLSYDPETIWVHPKSGGLEAIDFSRVSQDSPAVIRLLRFLTHCAREAQGEWFMGLPPMGNAGDTIARMRSYGAYCEDLYDAPGLVEVKEMQLATVWRMLFAAVADALSPLQSGSCGWLPSWYEGRLLLLEFDFCALISPEHFKLFVPAMERRADLAGRTIFHLDGPGALSHLDMILSLPFVDAIQALPGAGVSDVLEWLPVYHKIQKAGKALYVGNSVTEPEAHALLKALRPEGLMLPVSFDSRDAAYRFAEKTYVI